MEKSDALSPIRQAERQLRGKLRESNALSARFGLSLSEQSIAALAQARTETLAQTGRIEFGASVLPDMIESFCDSPYLMQDDYEETLTGLMEAFYVFKNETRDRIADDELFERMRDCYDAYEGSLDAVSGMTAEALFTGGGSNIRTFGENEEDD